MKGGNPSLSIELLEKFSLFKIIFMLDGFEVKDALKVCPDLRGKPQSFEKYVALLIYHFSPPARDLPETEAKDLGSYICTNSLKLSNKQQTTILKYLHHLPYLEFYANQFDASEVGLILQDLGESWQETLDLLPPDKAHNLLSSIQSHNLQSFHRETPLIKVSLNRETSFRHCSKSPNTRSAAT